MPFFGLGRTPSFGRKNARDSAPDVATVPAPAPSAPPPAPPEPPVAPRQVVVPGTPGRRVSVPTTPTPSTPKPSVFRRASAVDVSNLLVNSPKTKLEEDEEAWLYDGGTQQAGGGRWSKVVVAKAVSASKTLVRLHKLEGDGWLASDAPEVEVDRRLLLPSNADRQDDTEDLAALSYLNEPAVMEHSARARRTRALGRSLAAAAARTRAAARACRPMLSVSALAARGAAAARQSASAT